MTNDMATFNSPWQNKVSIIVGPKDSGKTVVVNQIADQIRTKILTIDQIVNGVITVDVEPETEVIVVQNVYSTAILELYQVFCSAPGVAVSTPDKSPFLLENVKQIILTTTQTGMNAFPLEDYYQRGINVFKLPDDSDTVETVLSIIARKD